MPDKESNTVSPAQAAEAKVYPGGTLGPATLQAIHLMAENLVKESGIVAQIIDHVRVYNREAECSCANNGRELFLREVKIAASQMDKLMRMAGDISAMIFDVLDPTRSTRLTQEEKIQHRKLGAESHGSREPATLRTIRLMADKMLNESWVLPQILNHARWYYGKPQCSCVDNGKDSFWREVDMAMSQTHKLMLMASDLSRMMFDVLDPTWSTRFTEEEKAGFKKSAAEFRQSIKRY